MNNGQSGKVSVVTIVGIALLSIGILFFLLRGPYLSNSIKRILIPVLENATRERIIIDKAVINLFPFYVQAKGFKLFDRDGNRLLWITKTRAYIDLLGLLSKEIRVRKLTLLEPEITVEEQDIRRVMENLEKSGSVGDEGKYRVSIVNIKLTQGKLAFSGANGFSNISGSGLNLEMITRDISSIITVELKKGTIQLENQTELDGSFNGKITIKENEIEIEELNVASSDSSLSTKGRIILDDEGRIEEGTLSTRAKIYMSIINKLFSLKEKRDGLLSFEGPVRLFQRKDSKWPGFNLDLKTDSQFYLETLMEILKVKEHVTGNLMAKGKIRGTFPDIVGEGKAKLTTAVLGTLPIDDLQGAITYRDKRFDAQGFKAHIYNGTLEGNAHLLIPDGNYGVDARMSDVSSPRFFTFIKWEPHFQEGKISGDVHLRHETGHPLAVKADVHYSTLSPKEGNALNRMHSASTSLELRDNVLHLSDTVLSTNRSDLFLDGSIDLRKKILDLDLKLKGVDIADLTEPYYTHLSAPVRFEGTATGSARDPEIRGRIDMESGSVHGIGFTEASADLIYRVSSLIVDRLVISQDTARYDIAGKIDFRKAKDLFSFKDPFYRGTAEVKDVDISPFIKLSPREVPLSGFVSGLINFEGDSDNFVTQGDLSSGRSEVYGQQLDKVTVTYESGPEAIEFKSLKAYKAESVIEAEGTFFFNKNIDLSLRAKRIQLHDFPYFSDHPLDMMFGVDLQASGPVDNPDLAFLIDIDESLLKGVHAGKGNIKGTVENKELRAEGSLINGLVAAEVHALFSDGILWDVSSVLNKGRYDFLLEGFLDEIPEDFLVYLEGGVKLKGRGNTYSMTSTLNSATVSLYGYDFINRDNIEFELVDNEFRIKSFALAGKDADMSVEGAFKLYSNYNLHIKGNMEIAPLRAIHDRISSLRGKGDFNVDIGGSWKSPEVRGAIGIHDTTTSFSEFPYTIGPLNGTVFFQKDRFTFDSVRSKFAGGSVVMSGAGLLDGLSMKRFFVSADFNGIKLKPTEGLRASLDGRLFYDRSSRGSGLTGNIDIKRARYTKRIEWKSWLLGLKEINEEQIDYPAFLSDTVVNVHVTGMDNIIIDNNIARTPVRIALNLTGTFAHNGLLGRIEANEGTVYFRSNEFKVLEGSSVDFVEADRISPVFHILAETYINYYHVRLTLDGIMDEFTLSLFSDPPLTETDILALLTVGQTGNEARGIESGIAAGEATAILTGAIQDSVEEQFQYITGFERFEIEPHTTTEGAFVPKVTIGKRLFEDKLFVTYSTAIGTAEEDVIKLEYKIDRNLSLLGSRNEIGSAGLDLKYRFEFK